MTPVPGRREATLRQARMKVLLRAKKLAAEGVDCSTPIRLNFYLVEVSLVDCFRHRRRWSGVELSMADTLFSQWR
jgi:hypothetical protein